jgi:lysophospholipase L1-like esterase
VLIIGDSLSLAIRWPAYFLPLLPAGSAITVEAYGGQTSQQIYTNSLATINSKTFTDAIVLCGVNDVELGNTPDYAYTGLMSIYAACIAKADRVVAVQILPWRPSPVQLTKWAYTDTINAWVKYGYAAVNVNTDSLGIAGPPRTLLPAYDSGDGTHLNAAGYEYLANLIFRNWQ